MQRINQQHKAARRQVILASFLFTQSYTDRVGNGETKETTEVLVTWISERQIQKEEKRKSEKERMSET